LVHSLGGSRHGSAVVFSKRDATWSDRFGSFRAPRVGGFPAREPRNGRRDADRPPASARLEATPDDAKTLVAPRIGATLCRKRHPHRAVERFGGKSRKATIRALSSIRSAEQRRMGKRRARIGP
jgi:hypothetical protein